MPKLALRGGEKTVNREFPPQQDFGEEEKRLVLEVIDSKMISGFLASPGERFMGGPKLKELERLFKEYYGTAHALAVNSATAGLHAAIAAINVNPGDEVIVPPYSMCASATAIVMHNAIPVFVDIDERNFNIDPQAIRKAITPQTKAIVVVHLFGYPADMDEIMKIAREHGLKVIEDVAQAPACAYKGRLLGTIGDLGVFSFNQNKTISTGEGGMVLTNDDQLARRISLIRNHGEVLTEHYPVDTIAGIVGYNYRMTELEAAMGIAQWGKLQRLTEHRVRLAKYLTQQLKPFAPMIQPIPVDPGRDHVYFVYPMKFNARAAGIHRNTFAEAVRAEGLPMVAGYLRPIYWEPMYQQLLAYGDGGFPFRGPHVKREISYPKGLAPVCERMYMEELLTTPLCRFPLTETDIDDLVRAMAKVLDNTKELLS